MIDAAEIDAQHQHDAELRRDEAARRPASTSSSTAAMLEWNSQVIRAASRKAVTGSPEKIVDDHRQQPALPQRLGGLADHLERQDQEADADQDAAELAPVAALGRHEHGRAGDQADRNEQAQVEGQQLDDERGADIGAEHGKLAGRCR